MKRLQRKSAALFVVLTIFSIGIYSCQDNLDDSDAVSQQDRDFAVNAAYYNISEVQLGELAFQKSENDSVMNYGKSMIMYHTPIRNKLDSIARAFSIDLPGKMDKAHQALYNRLSTLNSFAFDTAYMNSRIKDQQGTIAIMEKQRDTGNNRLLIEYANKNLPYINSHRQHAIRLLEWLNNGGVAQ